MQDALDYETSKDLLSQKLIKFKEDELNLLSSSEQSPKQNHQISGQENNIKIKEDTPIESLKNKHSEE